MYTQTDIENANEVLQFLVNNAEDNIQGVMADNLGDSEYKLNIENMNKNLEAAGREEAYGAVAQGTGIIKDEVGLDGEAGQNAIKLLKERFRIQQCGRGRGRVLIVLDPTPLGEEADEQEPTEAPVMVEEAEKEPVETETEIPTDTDKEFDALVDQLRDRHHQALDALHERDETIARLRDEVDELKQELEAAATATWS